jgi:tetratricopeptide (TPR) repeat protein
LEYIFKHALTHEIVYNGLVKAERYLIHEKIGNVIELLFQDRLSEFYETLAFHFSRSNLDAKAVDYLLKAGQRCLAKFAADEAHLYFKKAYDIIASKEEISEAEKNILINILNNWGYSFYYLGEFNEFVEIFRLNMATADSLEDKASVGMFYAWFGIALLMAGNAQDSYGFLCKSLKLGEKAGAQKVVGYACTWLAITCAEIGHFSEGIGYSERAQAIAESYPSDQYLFFKSLFGLSWIYLYMGNSRDVFAIADRLLEYGEINANSRSKVFGIWMKAFGHLTIGDMKSCQEYSKKAMEVAIDPYYTQFPLSSLGMSYFLDGQFHEAENVFKSVLEFSKKRGIGQVSVFAQCYLAPVLIAKGKMTQGMKMLKEAQEKLIKNNRVPPYAMTEFILGEVNSQIATGSMPSFSVMAKNIGFLAKYIPAASNNAEKHYKKSIKIFNDIGAKGFLGIALMSLGLFYKARKRSDEAKQCLLDAIEILQECGAVIYLEQANKALDSLK